MLKTLNRVSVIHKSRKDMTKFKFFMLLIVATFISTSAFSQLSLNVNKALSETDKKEVESILKSFDANSYSINVKAANGTLNAGTAKGLGSVTQSTTKRPGSGSAASTNSNINLFVASKASTNTNINLFVSSASKASTNSNINIFKQGNYTAAQLSQLDKLHQVLSKYQ